MPFLRIDGIEIDVDATSVSQSEPREVGMVDPAFSGKLRTSVQKEFRSWRCSTIPYIQGDADLILARFVNGRFCICDGDMIGFGQIRQCHVVATEKPYHHDGQTGHLMSLHLRIEETTGVQYAP